MWKVFPFFLSSVFFFCTTDEVSNPRPMGYFRLTFPEKKYVDFPDTSCPFSFQVPQEYCTMVPRKDVPCWYNLEFYPYRATLHISYKKIENNLPQLLEDSRLLVMKHISKASNIDESIINNPSTNVYGTIYRIKGNVGTGMQFHLTDSTHHFLRGSLYFNIVPNPDSVAPIEDFLEKDILQLIQTFQWK